jgi:hypothetical protein
MIGLNKTCKSLIHNKYPTFINKSYEVCGGSSDQYKACIFDYLATGDTSFAADTQSSNTEYSKSEVSVVVSPEIKLNWRRLHKCFGLTCI